MKQRTLTIAIFSLFFFSVFPLLAIQPKFSTAGFYQLEGTGRQVYSMNVAWRFFKGDVLNASEFNFDDSKWDVVSLPHGIEYLPLNASGSINYQGKVWYRKHFSVNDSLQMKKLFIHFEAIMGKSKVWVNGQLVKEHFGGYLPVIADISKFVKFGKDNVITVLADNSDDPLCPPGKSQSQLDFCYFGGIYRDCWLVAHNNVYITDPNFEKEIAGGGVLLAFNKVSKELASILLKIHIRNQTKVVFSGTLTADLIDKNGVIVSKWNNKINILNGVANSISGTINLKTPNLWSPELPYLYSLNIRIKDGRGKVIDGYSRRVGIRSIEFKQKEGLFVNSKPYPTLIGVNRHMDFAVVGNAVPNSIQWLDAKRLKDAGSKIIRNGHEPVDPAFMDACDELGLFLIDNTPGWQFWNKEPIFGERVYDDIRNMIRRDRNHACLFMWEPVLNETYYPNEFAKNALNITLEEFPYPNSSASCDDGAAGSEYFKLLLRPGDVLDSTKTYFVREWGDNVDDWYAQNSNSRVNRSWGEVPMLIQAQHYADNNYGICIDQLYTNPRIIVGGTLWHSFDHQRGYHTDPFLGGIMDAFRQPKYSYYMFMSQRDNKKIDLLSQTGPMIYIAHEMTPFSPKDVTVYSNCDEVRLTFIKDGKVLTQKKDFLRKGMPSPIFTFADMYDFMTYKHKFRDHKHTEVYLLAEGIIDGKVVATHKVVPSSQAAKIVVEIDHDKMSLLADGSDFVTVIASVTDKNGNIKRLNNSAIRFSVEGEGRILGGEDVGANPRQVLWGTAPVLIQSTTKPGKIKIKASMMNGGLLTPLTGELEITSVQSNAQLIYSKTEAEFIPIMNGMKMNIQSESDFELNSKKRNKELLEKKNIEVGKQQTDFGKGIN